MSLRFRLSLLITLLFALILLGGSVFVISHARKAVIDEVQASARFTLQLIEIALTGGMNGDRDNTEQKVLDQIAGLESTRHLDIQLQRVDGTAQLTAMEFPISADAPPWFVRLVKPPPIEHRRVIFGVDLPRTEILIRADPSAEITEVWGETKGVLGLLILFVVSANLLVFFTLGWGLAPIETILSGLGGIEKGDYRLRLPPFKLPELGRISEKFNHMAEVLQRSREENRFLTQRSLAIQEDERRKLAHELHDELGQSISAIKAMAVSIGQRSAGDQKTVSDSAGTIIEVSNHMYEVARSMMRRLRPAVLDELGLVTALQDMIDDWNSRHQDLFCYSSFEGDLDNLGDDINISIYRIVQESLTNIVKHARAGRVDIHIVRKLSGADQALTEALENENPGDYKKGIPFVPSPLMGEGEGGGERLHPLLNPLPSREGREGDPERLLPSREGREGDPQRFLPSIEGKQGKSLHSLTSREAKQIEQPQSRGGFVHLIIRDDGRGFDMQATRWGLGLLGMRERVEALNGSFKLFSAPGKGVELQIQIPVAAGGEH